jgi:hypothetical protein
MEFKDKLNALVNRNNLNDGDLATLLGVPTTTSKKWARGDRSPSGAAARLVDVLCTVEALSPALFEGLIVRAPVQRKRRPKGAP